MTKHRAVVIAQVIVYGALVTIVGFFVAVGASHERRIDMLAQTMARSLAVQERVVQDVAENRQVMIALLERVCKVEGEGREREE